MVKSYRGQEIDMEKLIASQGDTMSLGTTNLNGRGDEVKHGKVVKTRAERLKEYLEKFPNRQAKVNLADDKFSEKVESEVNQASQFEEIRKAFPKRRNAEPKNEEE